MQDQPKETSSRGLQQSFCQTSKLEKLQRCHLSSNVGGCRWIQLIQPCNLQAGKTFFIIMQMHLRPTIFVYHPHTAIEVFYKENAQDLIIGININTDTPYSIWNGVWTQFDSNLEFECLLLLMNVKSK